MRLIKKHILLVFLFLSLYSCEKDFETINSNPLAPSDVSYGALFNELVSSLRLGWNRQLFLHNEVLYDVTEQAVVTAQTFGNTTGGTEDIWTNYYTALKNANELYRRFDSFTEDPEIADILRAQLDVLMAYKTFQVTDLFGDIPYTEAGLAFADDPVIRAKYDDQESIYKSLIDQLAAASVTLAKGGETSLGNSYLRYSNFETFLGDDIDKWIRFSNTLQLRHLIRMYEKAPEFVESRVATFIQSGANTVIKGSDILMSPAAQSWSNLGVNWSFREHNKVRMGSTVWNQLTDEQGEIIDPRAHIFFEPNVDEEWVAFPQIPDANTIQSGGEPYNKDRRDNAYDNKGDGNIYASVNFYLIRDEKDIPEILITSAEAQFLKAEIFLRGIGVAPDPFLASSFYQNGMIESLEFWQNLMINSAIWINKPAILSTGELFATVQHPKYSFNPSNSLEENLRLIYTQRWIDSFRQPWEAFSLLRRTNNVPREKEANTFFRFQYPPSETALNSEQYQNQITKMGADASNIKVWWME